MREGFALLFHYCLFLSFYKHPHGLKVMNKQLIYSHTVSRLSTTVEECNPAKSGTGCTKLNSNAVVVFITLKEYALSQCHGS